MIIMWMQQQQLQLCCCSCLVSQLQPQHALAVGLISAAVSLSPISIDPAVAAPVPVLEVIKVYGRLAGPECYGKTAPIGSSCQVTEKDVMRTFQLDDVNDSSLTEEDFRERLSKADFQWPLKPYGIDKSLTKTATMNKGAETRVYMDLLEERGLYDRRNPTGPLPSSLRPTLNKQLQQEGIDSATTHRVFEAMGGKNGQLQSKLLRKSLLETPTGDDLDYYGFLDLIGKETVIWP